MASASSCQAYPLQTPGKAGCPHAPTGAPQTRAQPLLRPDSPQGHQCLSIWPTSAPFLSPPTKMQQERFSFQGSPLPPKVLEGCGCSPVCLRTLAPSPHVTSAGVSGSSLPSSKHAARGAAGPDPHLLHAAGVESDPGGLVEAALSRGEKPRRAGDRAESGLCPRAFRPPAALLLGGDPGGQECSSSEGLWRTSSDASSLTDGETEAGEEQGSADAAAARHGAAHLQPPAEGPGWACTDAGNCLCSLAFAGYD